jgi:hypothetical protein
MTDRATRARRRARLAAAGAALALAAWPAAGQSTRAFGSPEAQRLVQQLDADDFDTRAAAQQALVHSPEASDAELVELLRSGRLSAEQELRLVGVLRARFGRAPRGAIGIQFAQPRVPNAGDRGGLPVVGRVYEQYPAGAAGLVRAGDAFVEVDGIRLDALDARRRTLALQAATFSRAPGELLPVVIERPVVDAGGEATGAFEQVAVRLPLGSAKQLRQNIQQRGILPSGLTESEADLAWQARMARLGLASFDVIRTPSVAEGVWREPPPPTAPRGPGRPKLVAGPLEVVGEPAGLLRQGTNGVVLDERMIQALVNQAPGEVRVRGGARLIPRGAAAPIEERNGIRRLREVVAERDAKRATAGEFDAAGAGEMVVGDPLERANRIASELIELRSQLDRLAGRAGEAALGMSAETRRVAERRGAEIRARVMELEIELERTLVEADAE